MAWRENLPLKKFLSKSNYLIKMSRSMEYGAKFEVYLSLAENMNTYIYNM